MQVMDFVQDSTTPADIQTYGFSNAVQTITLRSGLGSTRPVIGELLVGGSTTNGLLYVKRSERNSSILLPILEMNFRTSLTFFVHARFGGSPRRM